MSKLKKKKGYKLFLFLLPGLIYVFVFSYMPLWGWAYAFVDYVPGKKLLNCDFVGFKNFAVLFGNPILRKNLFQALANTLGIHFLSYIFMPLPMLFAVFLNELPGRRFKKVVQTASTLPHFVSWVIMFALATSLLSTTGLLNTLLIERGMIEEPINVLTTDKHVWLTQVLLQQWKGLGWSSIVYFAAIAGIDQEMYEAAVLDGANAWQKIRYITIPMLIPMATVMTLMGLGGIMHSDTGLFYQVTKNVGAIRSTTQVLDSYVMNAIMTGSNYGMTSAFTLFQSVVGCLMLLGVNGIVRRVDADSALF